MTVQPGTVRYQVDLYLPTTELDARGRRKTDAEDTLVLTALPASIEQLADLELIRARKQWEEATHRVRVTLWPGHAVTTRHYLLFGTRRLHIGAVVDAAQTGIDIELLCREEV